MENFWIDIYNTNEGYTLIDKMENRNKEFWERAVKAYSKDIYEGWVNIDHYKGYTAGNLLALELRKDGKIWGFIEPNQTLKELIDEKLVKYRSIEFRDNLDGFNTPYITGVAFLTSSEVPASKGLNRLADVLKRAEGGNKRYLYKSVGDNFRATDFVDEIDFNNYIKYNVGVEITKKDIGGNISMDTNDRKVIDDLNARLLQIEKEKQENELRLSLENEKLKKEVENVSIARKQDEVKNYFTKLLDEKRILPRTIDAGFGELCMALIENRNEVTINNKTMSTYELFRSVVDSFDNKETTAVNTESTLDFKALAEQRKEKVDKKRKEHNKAHPDDEYDAVAKKLMADAFGRGETLRYDIALERALEIIKTQKKGA